MKEKKSALTAIGVLLLCVVLPAAVSATTLIAESGTIPSVGGTEDFTIIADSLPNGLSGFEITVALSNPAKAEIIQVITPAWAGNPPPLSVITTVPTDSVGILIIDFYENVNHSVSNLELVTLRVRGDSAGTTGLNVSIDTLQDKDGYAIAALVQNGTITVGSTPPPPQTGTLSVTSNPTPADVFLDGVYKGTTPIVIPDVTTGIHTVRVEKAGYSPLENLVTITTGLTTSVHATLTEIPPVPVNGTLNVETTPPGAAIFLDGLNKGVSPLTIPNVPAGMHTLRLERTGYATWENQVTISAGQTTNVTTILVPVQPAPVNGTLNVTTTPSGAAVSLDGLNKGVSPLTLLDIPAGIHTLRLDKTGYQAWENPVTILAGQITNVTVVLSPAPPLNGSLNVRSDPAGGNIYLDGVLRGITPFLIPGITPGTHLVRIEKGGFEAWEEVVGVSAGLTTEVNATLIPLPPPPASGSFSVQSTPPGANVYLDGVMTGITPVLIPGVAPGTHTVRIEKTGYGAWESNMSVAAGATTLVSATLFPIPPPLTGSINVQTEPADANVSLDGIVAGISPVLMPEVTPGMHTIRIEKAGYIPWENQVSVSAGATTVVSVVLELVPPPLDTGGIDVQSDPSGANTYLDGVLKGITPLSIVGITPGSHVLKLNMTGYEPWEETITVVAGEVTLVNETLSPIVTTIPTVPAGYGSIYVSSLPSRAKILIDSTERGMTDVVLSNIAAGTHQVTIEKAGYESQSFPVTVSKGKLVYLQRVILEPDTKPTIPTTIPTTQPTQNQTTLPTTTPTTLPSIPPPSFTTGSIYVISMPFGSSVYIDDIYKGLSPVVVRGLSPGEHIVRITLSGYQDEVRQVQVKVMKSTLVTVVQIPDVADLASAIQ